MINKMATVRNTCVMRGNMVFCQLRQMSTPSGFVSDGVDPFPDGVDKCHESVLFTHFNIVYFNDINFQAFYITVAQFYVLNFNHLPYSFMFSIESHFNSLSST